MTIPVSSFLGDYDLQLGLNSPPTKVLYEFDKTDSRVATYYASQIQVIYDVFSKPSSDPITNTDLGNVQTAITNLVNLAQGNSTANVQTNPDGSVQRYFLTIDMVQSLDLLLRSFQAAGVTSGTTPTSLQTLQAWKDYSLLAPSIQEALLEGLQATKTNRSIQSLVELDYVTAGNDLIDEKLSGLESALTLTKNLLDLMNNLQSAKNNVITMTRSASNEPYPFATQATGNLSEASLNQQFASNYQGLNSLFYNSPQFPIPNSNLVVYNSTYLVRSLVGGLFSLHYSLVTKPIGSILYEQFLVPKSLTAEGMALFSQILNYKKQLSQFLPTLLSTLGPDAAADENSLYSRSKAILDNLNEVFVAGAPTTLGGPVTYTLAQNITTAGDKAVALYRWLTDGNPISDLYRINTIQQGDVQKVLSQGITSAESLNDTQKESVRNFLFVFEEFYKSASAVLQRISQMIEKMASNISR